MSGILSGQTTESFDIILDDLETLSKTFYVPIDQDYHGRRIYEPVSLFTFITDLETYAALVHRFDETIISYTNSDSENVLHLTAKNPNPECMSYILDIIPDNYIINLANKRSRFGYYPIELTNDVDTFKRMISYTKMDYKKLLNCMKNSYQIAQHVCEIYQSTIESEPS